MSVQTTAAVAKPVINIRLFTIRIITAVSLFAVLGKANVWLDTATNSILALGYRALLLLLPLTLLVLGVLDGLLVAIGISLLITLKRLSNSSLSELGCYRGSHDYVALGSYSDVCTVPHVMILRPNAPLFSANVERVFAEVQRRTMALRDKGTTVILSLEETPDLDSTTLEGLKELMAFFEDNQTHLILARLKEAAYELLVQDGDLTQWHYVTLSRLSVSHAVKDAKLFVMDMEAKSQFNA